MKTKSPNDYAKLSFRPPENLAKRINALKAVSGMSLGQIVNACLLSQLPAIEARKAARKTS